MELSVSFPNSVPGSQPTPDEDIADDAVADDAEETQEEQASTETLESLRKQLKKAEQERETFRRRFTGLQPVVQREAEEKKRLAAQLAAYEGRLVEMQIASLPEDQQQAARMLYQMEQTQRQQQEQQRQQEYFMTEVLKDTRMKELAQSQGVPQELLGEFLMAMDQGPAAALEFFATRMSKATKTTRKETRKQTQADKFEGGGGSVSRQAKPPEDYDEAAVAFREGMAALAAASRR